MPAVMIRIDEPTRNTLRELSEKCDESMTALVAKAVEDFRRKKFLEAANAGYAALRSNPEAWSDEERERAAWDATAGDGLDA